MLIKIAVTAATAIVLATTLAAVEAAVVEGVVATILLLTKAKGTDGIVAALVLAVAIAKGNYHNSLGGKLVKLIINCYSFGGDGEPCVLFKLQGQIDCMLTSIWSIGKKVIK